MSCLVAWVFHNFYFFQNSKKKFLFSYIIIYIYFNYGLIG